MRVGVSEHHVQLAARAIIDAPGRLDLYLSAIEDDLDLPAGTLGRATQPVSFDREIGGDDQRVPPYVVAVCPGVPTTSRRGQRQDGVFRLGLVAVVEGGYREDTDRRASLWGTALTAIAKHNATLDGLASDIEWVGRRLDVYAWERGQTLNACEVLFDVTVRDAVDLTEIPGAGEDVFVERTEATVHPIQPGG